jgi:prophage regulatory protein
MKITIQPDRDNDQLYLAFSGLAIEAGVVGRTIRVTDDVALDFDKEGRVIGLDIGNASQVLGESIDEVRLDALVGVKEAARLLGVQKSNFVRDYANKPDFPRPVIELATGRIWLRSQVEAYAATKARPGVRRRAAAE